MARRGDHQFVRVDAEQGERYPPARAALAEYVASHNPAPRRDGGLYYTFQVADVDFFVLDTRSYRHPNTMPDGSAKTMLGAEQKADLKAWLAASPAPFKVILSSVPFHDVGQRRVDAWTSFAAERAERRRTTRARSVSPRSEMAERIATPCKRPKVCVSSTRSIVNVTTDPLLRQRICEVLGSSFSDGC